MPKYYIETGYVSERIDNCHSPEEVILSVIRDWGNEIVYRIGPLIYVNEVGFMFEEDSFLKEAVKIRQSFMGEVHDFDKEVATIVVDGDEIERPTRDLSVEGCCLLFNTNQVFDSIRRLSK